MRIKKISPTTPANGNIENQYGTSQTNAYSEAYANTTFATKDVATTSANGLMSSSDKTLLNNETTYSTTETRIGTWIDGEPLYRRAIEVTSINNSSNSSETTISIPNLKEIINIKGSVKPNFAAWKPINHLYVTNSGVIDPQYTFQLYSISNTALGFSYGNWWKTVFQKAIVILEYTKY